MKKSAVILFTIVMLLVSVMSINVSAIGELAIASVHFDAEINQDGTVDVTETWNVEYSETGDGFTRGIDLYDTKNSNNMSLLEKFEAIENIAVRVNGNPVKEAQSGNETFRCGKTPDSRSFVIETDSPSAAETKEYVITYTLTGAVKKNGKNAEFAYVFLGETFDYVSNNVSATVYFPDGTVTEDIIVSEDAGALVDETGVKYSPGRVYDNFRIDVKCSAEAFDSDSLVKYSAVKEGMRNVLNVLITVGYWMFIGAVAIVVVILALFGDKLRRSSVERKAKKQFDANGAENATELPCEVTPCVAYKMIVPYSRISPKSTAKKVPVLFAMAVLECIENGYIVSADDGLMVGTPAGDIPLYVQSVLNFLKTFSEKKGNRYILDKSFAERIEAECMTSYDNISNYLATFYNLIPSAEGRFFRSEENKELYSEVYKFRCYVESAKPKTTFAECMRSVVSGRKTREAEIFSLLFVSGKGNKVFNDSSSDIYAHISTALAAMYNVYLKSK